jgi:hypothetical protein
MFAQLITMPIPYELNIDQLVLERGTERAHLGESLQWLVDETPTNEEECARILLAAVETYYNSEGAYTLASCLETAMIWERG